MDASRVTLNIQESDGGNSLAVLPSSADPIGG